MSGTPPGGYSLTPPTQRRCPLCGEAQELKRREGRVPEVQWECEQGHAFPNYDTKEEA